MPISPPRVFVITSVISLAPIEKINCKISNARLTKKAGKSFWRKDFFSDMALIRTPKGIKAKRFWKISEKSTFPFTITD